MTAEQRAGVSELKLVKGNKVRITPMISGTGRAMNDCLLSREAILALCYKQLVIVNLTPPSR